MKPAVLVLALITADMAPLARAAESTPVLDVVLEGPHDPTVPTPHDVLGFTPGARPARHADVVRYLEALDAASPRVHLERYGRTHEGRDLLLLFVSSEQVLARREEARANVERLSDPRRALPEPEMARLIEATPAVAFLAYSIHGDEFSGVDAALHLAWHLAAGESDDVRLIRQEMLVLIDPIENPDGRERVLSMNSAFTGAIANPDPESLSHQGTWPWGRTNHYLFDLNRDWFALVHPETRGRVAILRDWHPQLVVDAHEMGSDSTFLFNPPRAPYNPMLPTTTRRWWDRFSADHARAFDRRGWSYFSGEWNEEFFPGYGSALPLYQGAVALLHEQAGSDAQSIRKPHGAVMRYEETVARQVTSSLANLGTAAANREELLRGYRAARAEAMSRARDGVAAYYVAAAPRGDRAARLASNLVELGIEVERLVQPATLRGLRTLEDGASADVRLPAGSFRIRLDQPSGLLAATILQPHVPMADSFLAEEREHVERQKGTRIYDTTAWSPLLASGVDAWWTKSLDAGRWERADAIASPSGVVNPGDATYGFVFDCEPDGAPALAADLLERGLVVRVGEKPLVVGSRTLSRGSFLLRTEENPADMRAVLTELAPARGVEVVPASSGRPTGGPDLGGSHWPLLEAPRIALVAGSPTDPGSVGFAWHLLEKELGLRVSLVDAVRLSSLDLVRYNVLVFPDAWGGGYERVLGEAGLDALRRWIENGGTFVGMGSGAQLAATESAKLSAVRLRQDVVKDFPAPRLGLSLDAVRALERMQATGLPPDGKAVPRAGAWREEAWPAELGVPGPGSPVLGAGVRALLGMPAPHPKPAKAPKDEKPATEEQPAEKELKEAELKEADGRLKRFLPSGAILRVDVDPEHWLAYGVGDDVTVMTGRDEQLVARDPVETVGRYAHPDRLHLGGLLWPEASGRISLTAWLTREGKGRGQVILFASDPNFRGYFWDSERPFLNAVLLGPGLGTTRTIKW